MGERDDIITSLQARLQPYFGEHHEVVAVYLFGSQAKGSATVGSDVDLALLLSTDFDLQVHALYRLRRMTELETRLSTDVDVVILNQASLVLRHQVLKYGRLIYTSDQRQRVDFEVRAMQEYHDFQPALALFDKALLQHIQEGRLADGYRGHHDPLGDARRIFDRLERAANDHPG